MTIAIARTLISRTAGRIPRVAASAASLSAPSRRFISIKPLYTAEATSTGGRNGRSVSSDNVVNVSLTLPKELGGPGEPGKTNPEQLFAAGYSACFQGAMGLAAKNLKVNLPESNTVTGVVHIGKDQSGGLGLAVELRVHAPGLDKETTQKVVDLAHTICPYSRATKGNIDVKLSVV
ncbi:OsmC/Ohr family [Coemansia spiralis]|nr:OsmC/Ohr family [Coemansia spiralis]